MILQNIKRFGRLVAALVLVALLFVAALPTVSARADSAELKFDETNVLDDLRASEDFNLLKYPFDPTGKSSAQIINFSEYAYSYKVNMQENYGLYIYVYNPSGHVFDEQNLGNQIQLAASYKANADGETIAADYVKLPLTYCSKSTETGYVNLFYKFRIKDVSRILTRINAEVASQQAAGVNIEQCVRRYDVSGTEIVTKGESNAHDYTIGGIFSFTGYGVGYGSSETESTLQADYDKLETIELDLGKSLWRTNSSDKGDKYQYDVNTVYFAVDKKVLAAYGVLQKIKAEWYEYKTSPVYFSNDEMFYNNLKIVSGSTYSPNWDGGLFPDRVYPLLFGQIDERFNTSKTVYLNNAWGVPEGFPNCSDKACKERPIVVESKIDKFYWIMKANARHEVPAADVMAKIYGYKGHDNGYLPIKNGTVSADLFQGSPQDGVFVPIVDGGRTAGYNCVDIDAGDTFDLLSFESTQNFWDKVYDYGFFETLFDQLPPDSGRSKITPIYELKDSDLSGTDVDISNRLLLHPDDISAFKDYTSSAKDAQKQVFLFRFAKTDYWVDNVAAFMGNDSSEASSSHYTGRGVGYVATQTVFLDFDIIHLTFRQAATYTMIPVVSSPIDIINGFTPPPTRPGATGCNSTWVWWGVLIVLGIVLLPLLITLLIRVPGLLVGIGKLLWLLLKGLFYIVASPVFLTVWIVKKVQKNKRLKNEKVHAQKSEPNRIGLSVAPKTEVVATTTPRRRKKTGWADTKVYPHAQHPAFYKKKSQDDIDYVTFTHEKSVDLDNQKIQGIPLTTNIDKSGKDKRTTHVLPRVYKGKRSALGKEKDKYRLVKADKKTVDEVFERAPVVKVPKTGGSKMRIRQKKKPHKK